MVLIAKDDCIEVFEIRIPKFLKIPKRLRRKPKPEESGEILWASQAKKAPVDGDSKVRPHLIGPKPKRKSKPEPSPENLICLLRSGRYKNEEQLGEILTTLFSKRNKSTTLFLILKDKGPLKDWLVDNEFQYKVYEKREGEVKANRNFRILNDAKAVVAFINRKSTGDKHWEFINAFLEMNKNCYLVYDEAGIMWDKKRRKRPATPYAQDS